jgi:LacI family transcriptional regulator
MRAPKIALLVETSREYGRGILRGIIRYQNEHGPWSIYFKPQGLGAPPPQWLHGWNGDGILARINDYKMAKVLSTTTAHIVDLRNALPLLNLPTVAISNHAVVNLAINHFFERGYRQFAFCGTRRGENRNQDEKGDLFAKIITEKGYSCYTYIYPKSKLNSWESEQLHIVKWLKTLPTPTAILTCHDDKGQQVIDACRRANRIVPDEIAILGIDNDPFLCNLSNPQLSSIDVYPERIGYEAAALLDRLMQGEKAPVKPLLYEPRGLVIRQSTDFTAVSDPIVAQITKKIRACASDNIDIEQILEDIPISRSSLFRRFKAALGRSPKKELTRVRVELAKSYLTSSTLRIDEIANKVFHSESKHFIETFRNIVGTTPLNFRKERTSHDL